MANPVKAAMKQDGKMRGKPSMGKMPASKGDGMKAAMKDAGKSPSKLSNMAAAKKKERA